MEKITLPTSLEGKTFLIAGKAGFVPSYVCEHYLELGAKVIGLDNFITGSESNIELLSKYKNFEFHQSDVSERLPQLTESIDYVLSLASPASPIDFKVIPFEIMKVNSLGSTSKLAQPGSALFWGDRGRWFKSSRSDHLLAAKKVCNTNMVVKSRHFCNDYFHIAGPAINLYPKAVQFINLYP